MTPDSQKGLDLTPNPRLNGTTPRGPKLEINDMRLLSLSQVREILNLGKYSLGELINRNELRSVKIGHRRLVSTRALRDYLNRLENISTEKGNYGR